MCYNKIDCQRKILKEGKSMAEPNEHAITIADLRTYLYSLEHEKNQEVNVQIHDYKRECSINERKPRKREIAKIEKQLDKEYSIKFKVRDEILDLIEECKSIPKNVEKLEITEYMLYRVDIRKAEKVANKAAKRLKQRYENILDIIDRKINEFHVFDDIEMVDYSEYQTSGQELVHAKEQYTLEFTEEQKNKLIEKELEIVEKVKTFNSVPIPHEILKNSDKEIQFKMQKFNNIRQKRIRILNTMPEDYKKLIEPRELLAIIDEAILGMKQVQDILTKTEYLSIKKALIRRRKKVYRSTNEVRYVVEAKEKKTGITSFNIQEARYERMENLRNTIQEAIALIKQNAVEDFEKQLGQLKISYEREKKFASVIEKLDDGTGGEAFTEVKAYEEQINSLESRINNSKKIIAESQEKIKHAKQELLVLWKIEINSAVTKKKETLDLPAPGNKVQEIKKEAMIGKKAFMKLKKSPRGKHAVS